MTNKGYKMNGTGFLVLVVVLVSLISSAVAQNYQEYVKGQPRKDNYFSEKEFSVRMGSMSAAGPGSSSATQAAVTGGNESNLPFAVDKNYPDFYFIPPEKRPRVVNQGSCGSCVAWSSSTAMATVLANEGRYKSFISGLSMPNAIQLFLFNARMCVKELPNYAWFTDAGVKALSENGVAMSVTEPASNAGSFGASFATNMGDWYVKANKWGSLTNKDAMRKFIANKGALVADFTTTPVFNRYDKGIYNQRELIKLVTAPLTANSNTAAAAKTLEESLSRSTGGHAVTVIGYFKGGNLKLRDYMKPLFPPNTDMNIIADVTMPNMPAFWIVQNSWGTGWGMNGLFYIAADENYDVFDYNEKTKVSTKRKANQIDDTMYYILEPRITSKGKEIF